MKLITTTVFFTAVLYLSGCASGAKMENMIYQGEQKQYSEQLKNSVDVSEVSGGQKTNPAWTSEISNEDFSGAIKESLIAQGLYSDDGRYKLSVQLLEVDQPLFGLDMEVTTHVQYSLLDSASNAVVLEEKIVTPYTATFSDAFAAMKRLRLANEGSGQKNIEAFLGKLSTLNIGQSEISLAK